MSKKKRGKSEREIPQKRNNVFLLSDTAQDLLCVPGYTSLAHNPEIMTGCRRIAELIGTLTIYLMENGENGDKRVINELSRKIDISPCRYMTRKTFIEILVMNLLLYGHGNSVVRVRTSSGLLDDLEPIAPYRVSFRPENYGYQILIDGIPYSPDELLHFVMNPDEYQPWIGQGFRVSLRDIADNLKQAAATEKAFMESKWKPSLIVKVDALTEEFSNPAGRKKLLDSYVASGNVGEPWLIPAEQFQVEQIRPLSLEDLAIADVVELDKRTIAAILGIPPFLLGIGEYSKDAWNAFVNTTVKPIVTGIQQEFTRKLIFSPKWYIKFNILSLYDWDLQTISEVFGNLSDRGFVTGNEVRDRIGMSPLDGLDELRILENYIPYNMSGRQKKLKGADVDEDGTSDNSRDEVSDQD